MKRIISLIMSVVLVFSMSVTAFAAEGDSYHVIQDDAYVRIAEEYIGGERYVYTFDKEKQALITQIFDADGTLLSEETDYLADILNQLLPEEYDVSLCASGHYQNTLSNYEYEQIDSKIYELRTPSQHTYRKLPYDREAIDKYVEVVDKLNSTEFEVIAAVGVTAVGIIAACFSSGLTASQAAAAAGATITEATRLYGAIRDCQRVWELYVK